MSILVKHGDPGILVGLADAAGQLAGAGRVRDQVFQANLGDQSQRRAASNQFQNASGLESQRQAGQIAAQNNAAAIRQREIESVRRLSERDEQTGSYANRVGRRRAVSPGTDDDTRYEDHMALKAAELAERQRRNLAMEDANRESLALRAEADRRRFDQADQRIGQGQQRVEQGASRVVQGQQRVEQGAARVVQGDRRLSETERRNKAGETIRREQMQAVDERVAARAKKAHDRAAAFDKGSVAIATALPAQNLRAALLPVLSPEGPLDENGLPAIDSDGKRRSWSSAEKNDARRADLALRSLGAMRDTSGLHVNSLPELQERMQEIAADPELARVYLPTIEKHQGAIVRDLVEVFQQIGPVLETVDPAQAAEMLLSGAERAGMSPEDFTDSIEFLIAQGVIERPGQGTRQPPMGAGPQPEQRGAAETTVDTGPEDIEYDPETGEVYVKRSEDDAGRRRARE